MIRTLVAGLALLTCSANAEPSAFNLMPAPASAEKEEGRLVFDAGFSVAFHGVRDARLGAALARILRRLEERTGVTLARLPEGGYLIATDPGRASLLIECGAAGAEIPVLGEDESYALRVVPSQAKLSAPTAAGILRGLETWAQLVQSDSGGWFVPAVSIADRPRFPWRGLMIDVSRHWQPMDVIKRNLDGMALVKLNVLHLHLTDDQGFRIESRKFPRLHELGSDGLYFTQDEMRELIAYAAARCIRVVPEFDIPGHATSWLVGYPELGSAPGPYVIERKWGVRDPVLDPTNPKLDELLEGFLGEMAALFPDPYIHIGGDENNGVQWNANAKIQGFIREHELKDNAGLHAWFNGRIQAILAKHGKKLIGWDEILHPQLPAGSVVHSWRGPDGVAAATRAGFATILSHGYYIDLLYPAWQHYLNDPAPAGAQLTDAQRKLVLGGEATMWAEWVDAGTIDSRTWPRTAAIAERLWSPEEIRDVPDMYRRLAVISRRLEEAGLRHESYLDPALRRLAGDGATAEELASLRALVDLLEPVKRWKQPGVTQFTVLTGLADCCRADSAVARHFVDEVKALVLAKGDSAAATDRVVRQLVVWKAMADSLGQGLAARSPRLTEARPLLQSLSVAVEIGLEAIDHLGSAQAAAPDELKRQLAALTQAARPHAAVKLPIVDSVRLLAVAAAEQSRRPSMTDDAWLDHVRRLAQPSRAAAGI